MLDIVTSIIASRLVTVDVEILSLSAWMLDSPGTALGRPLPL